MRFHNDPGDQTLALVEVLTNFQRFFRFVLSDLPHNADRQETKLGRRRRASDLHKSEVLQAISEKQDMLAFGAVVEVFAPEVLIGGAVLSIAKRRSGWSRQLPQ
jgi:hypothetical protein